MPKGQRKNDGQASAVPDLSAPGALNLHNMVLERYGRLQEAGWFTVKGLNRSKENLAWLLKDDRWKICGFERIADFITSLELFKIKFDQDERRVLVKKIAAIAAKEQAEADRLAEEARRREEAEAAAALEREAKTKGITQRELAGALGVDPATVNRDLKEKAVADATPETAETRGSENVGNQEPQETADSAVADATPAPLYSTIVIDPPWPMKKIARDVRPAQNHMDYPTMPVAEIAQLGIPADENCHVWLWTTQKFLPDALACLKAWKFKYICTFVWHKSGGVQPVGLPQFNCEFVLYARRGAPKFIETTALPTCFQGERGAHSEKPSEFYAMVRRTCAGPRLDMFNRRPIDGFEGWGNEHG